MLVPIATDLLEKLTHCLRFLYIPASCKSGVKISHRHEVRMRFVAPLKRFLFCCRKSDPMTMALRRPFYVSHESAGRC